jgi:competence CoiA-like predicted nuclease
MAPATGQHMPETVWHYTAKNQLRAWAEMAGADSARVEEYTPDGRRRSDLAVTIPGGDRVAIEVHPLQN